MKTRYSLLLILFFTYVSLPTIASGFTVYDYAWNPGPNTVRGDGSQAPGGATWSAVPNGIHHALPILRGMTTTDIESLLTPDDDGLEYSLFNAAFDIWANAAAISNLGKVADGALLTPSAALGSPESSSGHIGDIRVSAFAFDESRDYPAIAFFPTDTSTLSGDILFDVNADWTDDPEGILAGTDFFTVALHAIGHALGLRHSDVLGSVMQAGYLGTRRTLHADDIAGIRAIYGVPEPNVSMMAMIVFLVLAGTRRKHQPGTPGLR